MLGKLLKDAREKAHLTQKDLAVKFYDDENRHHSISNIEADKITLSAKQVAKLQNIFNITDESFMGAWAFDQNMKKIFPQFKDKKHFKKAILQTVATYLFLLCLSPLTAQASAQHNNPTMHTTYLTVIYLIGSRQKDTAILSSIPEKVKPGLCALRRRPRAARL